jgi:hypothetical protein
MRRTPNDRDDGLWFDDGNVGRLMLMSDVSLCWWIVFVGVSLFRVWVVVVGGGGDAERRSLPGPMPCG